MLLNIFIVLNLMPLSDSLSGPNKWKSRVATSGLYCGCGNNSRPISPIFCTIWRTLCGKNHCHVEEWLLSAANRVAFCKLLVVIDQTITYSKSAFTSQISTKNSMIHIMSTIIHEHKVRKNNSLSVPENTLPAERFTLTDCRQSIINFSTFCNFCN